MYIEKFFISCPRILHGIVGIFVTEAVLCGGHITSLGDQVPPMTCRAERELNPEIFTIFCAKVVQMGNLGLESVSKVHVT